MSKLQIPSKIRLEDYKQEDRDLAEKIARSVNPFMDDVYRQMNGQLGFENLNRIIAPVSVKIGSSGEVLNEPQVRTSSLKSKVAGWTVIYAENLTNSNTYPTNTPFLSCSIGNGTITIKNITGLPANSEWKLVLEIIGN